MKCKQARAFASLMVGNDLEGDSQVQLQRHLAICPACRDFTYQMSASMQALQDAGNESNWLSQASESVGSESLWPRVAKVVNHKSPGSLRNRWFNGSVAALAIAATVLAMVSILQSLNNASLPSSAPPDAGFVDVNYQPSTPAGERLQKSELREDASQ